MYEISFSWTHALTIALVFSILLWWVIFHKAGKPSWYSFIPILNVITMINISGHPWWWIFLLLIPGVNIIVVLILWMDVARAFGKGRGFGLGLYFFTPVFGLILALSEAQYVRATPTATPYKPKLSVAILLTLLAVSMILSFFVVNWIEQPFQSDSSGSDPQNLTPAEIVQATDEAKFVLAGSGRPANGRPMRVRGTLEDLPVFHRLLVLLPIVAGLLIVVVWAYFLKLIAPEVALVALLNITAFLAILPFIWQNFTTTNLKLRLVDTSIRYIENAVHNFSALYNIETPVMLGAFAIAITLGEYAVFLHDRRHLQPITPSDMNSGEPVVA